MSINVLYPYIYFIYSLITHSLSAKWQSHVLPMIIKSLNDKLTLLSVIEINDQLSS